MPILTPLPSWRSKKAAVIEPALRQQAQVRQAPLTVMKSASALPTEDPMSGGGGEAPITILEELEDLEMQVKTKFDSAVKVGACTQPRRETHPHCAEMRHLRPTACRRAPGMFHEFLYKNV